MELTSYVTSLRNALAAAGYAASDEVREAADRLSYAVEPSLRLVLIDALSDAAAEITTELDAVSVEVRMRGGNPDLVVEDERMAAEFAPPAPPSSPQPPPHPGWEGDQNQARVSLRIPEGIKARVDEAAAAEGLSVNAWLVRSIAQTLDGHQPGVQINLGRRISGWAR